MLTTNTNQTKKLGEKFARKILKASPSKKAVVIALLGDLGGGKTTFLQGFAKGLGVKERITSPTFILMKKFQITNHKFQINSKSKIPKLKTFYHLDCYRISKPKEILELGFKEIIADPKNIAAIEWADRIKKILPKQTIWIKFEFMNKDTRKITIK